MKNQTKDQKIKYFMIEKRLWKSTNKNKKGNDNESINETNDEEANEIENENISNDTTSFTEIFSLLNFIISQKDRVYDYENKSHFINIIEDYNEKTENNKLELTFGRFISGKKGFCPPVFQDGSTTLERNPRRKNQMEGIPTHFSVFKTHDDYIYLLLESVGDSGIHYNTIKSYFNKYNKQRLQKDKIKRNYTIELNEVITDNFIEVINQLNRTSQIDIYADKQLLGDSFLSFSNRIEHVKREIKISLTAEKTQNIKEAAIDVFNILNAGHTSNIKRLRIHGIKNHVKQSFLIDHIQLTESIRVDLDSDTGLINTTSIKRELKRLSIDIITKK